jgi:hypothetical protein
MDEQAYQHWQVLHRRVIMGEALSGAEQAAYEAGCQELDAEERLDGGLQRDRQDDHRRSLVGHRLRQQNGQREESRQQPE